MRRTPWQRSDGRSRRRIGLTTTLSTWRCPYARMHVAVAMPLCFHFTFAFWCRSSGHTASTTRSSFTPMARSSPAPAVLSHQRSTFLLCDANGHWLHSELRERSHQLLAVVLYHLAEHLFFQLFLPTDDRGCVLHHNDTAGKQRGRWRRPHALRQYAISPCIHQLRADPEESALFRSGAGAFVFVLVTAIVTGVLLLANVGLYLFHRCAGRKIEYDNLN
jgi:hypothetical protein